MQIFPFRTETFISREVEALRAAGITVITLANQVPPLDSLDDESLRLCSTTCYVFPLTVLRILQIVYAHLWWLLHNFTGYLSCIQILMQEESLDRAIYLRNIKHFAGAVYLAHVIHKQNIQHIHAHYAINAATMALVIATLLNIPFSMTIHNIIFTDRTLMRTKLARAQSIVCISAYSRDALVKEYPDVTNLANKMPIIHCGIHANDFQIARNRKRDASVFVVMTACQLVERKGVRYLLEACGLLYQSGRTFRCIVAGDGEDRTILESLAEELGIAHLVEFVGTYTQKEMLEYFAQSDIFVLPCVVAKDGDRDGIPIVLMEAMAAGVPVISTRVSGIPALIVDNQNGHLVDEKDSEALAAVIQQHMDGAIVRERQIVAARMTIEGQFNMENSTALLIAEFNRKAPV
jgi:colanic acid/amylovoran biosynthesis glycosyltransferase